MSVFGTGQRRNQPFDDLVWIGRRNYVRSSLIQRFRSTVNHVNVGGVVQWGWNSQAETGLDTFENTLPDTGQPVSLEVRARVFGDTPDPARPFFFLNAYDPSNPVPPPGIRFKLRVEGLDAPRQIYFLSRRRKRFGAMTDALIHTFHFLDRTAVVDVTFPNGTTLNENEARNRRVFDMGVHDETTTPVVRVTPSFAAGFSIADLTPNTLVQNAPNVGVLKKFQNPHGGLNSAGRAHYNHEGHHLKPPAPHPDGPKSAARKHSFCARMSGVSGPMEKNGQPTRKALALRAWDC